MCGPTKNAKINYSEVFYFCHYFGAFSAVVGERKAMNCLEQNASKATSGYLQLTAA